MQLVSDKEKVVYRWESDKENSDNIVVTDKRLYHHDGKENGTHTCVNIENIKMVRFSSKREVKKRWYLTLFRVLAAASILFSLIDIASDLEYSADTGLLPLAVIVFVISIVVLYIFKDDYLSVMEIEYSSGNKIDIVMQTHSKTVMFKIRDAIFNTLDGDSENNNKENGKVNPYKNIF